MKWYADDSELNGAKGAAIPDILLFGGIIISAEAERELSAKVDNIKALYGKKRCPIKWNFRDLKKKCYLDNMDTYNNMLSSSEEWRLKIFQEIKNSNSSILISCVDSKSIKRDIIKDNKENYKRYCFSNGLMRYGMFAKNNTEKIFSVVLDWPDKSDSSPFDTEYAHAFNYGTNKDRSASYYCGTLSSINFCDSVLYARMKHSSMLQVADLIVGATKDFIEVCLGKKESGQGVDCLKIIKENFRGYPNNILGQGLIVSPNKCNLSAKISNGIERLL